MALSIAWPDGQVRCPYCGGTNLTKQWVYHRQPACRWYECGDCQTSFNDKTGTIFEHTKLPLAAWFLGFYLAQLSQSTATIARELPCDYHTAHRIVWLVREQVVRLEAGRVLQGTIEADEIYITAGHKGQVPGGGPKALVFPPRRRGWLATFRGVSQDNLPSYVIFFQFLRNHRHLTAFERSRLGLRELLGREAHLFAQFQQWLAEASQAQPMHPNPI